MLVIDDEDDIKGNKVAYCLFEMLNLLLIVMGAVILIAGTYLCFLGQSVTTPDLVILSIGIFIVSLGVSAFSMHDSQFRLLIYIACIIPLALFMLVAAAVVVSQLDKSIAIISQNLPTDNQERMLHQADLHVKTIGYVMVAATMVTVILRNCAKSE